MLVEEKIRNQLTILYNKQKDIYRQKRLLESTFNDLEKEICKLKKQFPKCSCCGHHQDPKIMFITTEEDVDNWVDSNEGYGGPEVGGYYCGC